MFLTAISLFIFGLIIGSFLNVVSFRYSPDKLLFDSDNYSGRSKCLSCFRKLTWYELIPLVSFLVQKGECRGCNAKISWQYFFVELASGLIFVSPLYFYTALIPFNYFLAFSIILVLTLLTCLLIWVIDYRLFIIPNELNIILAFLGLALIFVQDYFKQFDLFRGSFLGSTAELFGFRSDIWINHLIGSIVGIVIIGSIIYLVKFLLAKDGMGMGDLKMMGALGLVVGWPDIVFVLVFACIIGSIFSVYLLISKKKRMEEALPFAPFLAMGFVTLVFWGERIIEAYFRLFNFS